MANEAICVPVGLTTEGLLARRYMARFIDGVLLSSLAFIISLVAGRFLPDVISGLIGTFVLLLLIAVFWIGYEALLESSAWQATLGKRIMSLKVYDAAGGRLALKQAAVRNLVKDGPFLVFGLLPFTQFLPLAWLIVHVIVLHRSPVSQAIHDRVAHTWVAAPEDTQQLRIAEPRRSPGSQA